MLVKPNPITYNICYSRKGPYEKVFMICGFIDYMVGSLMFLILLEINHAACYS